MFFVQVSGNSSQLPKHPGKERSIYILCQCTYIFICFFGATRKWKTQTKKPVVLHLNVSSVLKLQSSLQYQNVPVVLNSVSYLLNILHRNALGEKYSICTEILYTMCLLVWAGVSNDTSTRAVFFLPRCLSAQPFQLIDLRLICS